MQDDAPSQRQNEGYDRRPVPDPTVLTTEALNREIERLRKDIEATLLHARELSEADHRDITTRIDGEVRFAKTERDSIGIRVENLAESVKDGVDAFEDRLAAARKLAESDHDTIATRLAGAVEVLNQRFSGVDQQFELIERQRQEQKQDTKAAVDSAFAAAKEAVKEQTTAFATATAKSENATGNQLTQLSENFKTGIAGIITSVDDLKERVSRTENLTIGATQVRTETRATSQWAVGLAIGAAVTLLGFFLSGHIH